MDLSEITVPDPVDDLFAPAVWLVVVGCNHSDDTVECIRSLKRSTYPRLTILFVDNGSRQDEYRRVVDCFDSIPHLRPSEKMSEPAAFNIGLSYAMREGADYIGMVDSDTVFDSEAVTRMVETAQADPRAGVVVPKVYHYEEPSMVLSAGARYRRFPPALVHNRTPGVDDGRHDVMQVVELASHCACIFRREMLVRTGPLDTVYRFFYEGYDYCLRAKEAGFRVRLAVKARVWHKASKVMPAKRNEFWWAYGWSHAIFCRRFPFHPYVMSRLSLPYLLTRALVEGRISGVRHFLGGWRKGRRVGLEGFPAWDVGERGRGV